ncbi:unnamed protein product [Paramecium sonneborni]|uniref:Uncharacterized protein n=1 Tax=Paramecium sonneborni TaxID=65129 RepID=A0A8S1P4V3_9CILI|nr:unnamed protein product [Paramecium sonneborni]
MRFSTYFLVLILKVLIKNTIIENFMKIQHLQSQKHQLLSLWMKIALYLMMMFNIHKNKINNFQELISSQFDKMFNEYGLAYIIDLINHFSMSTFSKQAYFLIDNFSQ